MASVPTEELKEFPGLSQAAFQHPLDIKATQNLQRVPLLPTLLKAVSSHVFEKQYRLFNISNRVRLSPKQGAHVYKKFEKAAATLDLPELPEIYVSSQYVVNATAFGLENYQITLYAGLIDYLTDEELTAVIGHELGHVKCEHMLYKSLAYILRTFGGLLLGRILPGVSQLALITLQLAILEWERMAELSCDRAALLVVQDEQVVASTLSKLAGGSKNILPEINLDEIVAQAEEYHEGDLSLIEKIFKLNMLLQTTHPFPVVRVKEIIDWSGSDQYADILAGNYTRKGEEGAGPVPTVLGPTLKKDDRLVCANCGIMVFETWTKCPGCGASLEVIEGEAGNGKA